MARPAYKPPVIYQQLQRIAPDIHTKIILKLYGARWNSLSFNRCKFHMVTCSELRLITLFFFKLKQEDWYIFRTFLTKYMWKTCCNLYCLKENEKDGIILNIIWIICCLISWIILFSSIYFISHFLRSTNGLTEFQFIVFDKLMLRSQ